MIEIDEDVLSFTALKGMREQIEIASKSIPSFHCQISEHYKKSFYDVKVYSNVRSAEDHFYNHMKINPKGRKRLIKIEGKEVTVIREQMGENV